MGHNLSIDAFIRYPWLALMPAGVFYALHAHGRRRPPYFAAVAWLVYFVYEEAMYNRILCSGDCFIRIDLLLLYPVLGLISMVGLVASTAQKP